MSLNDAGRIGVATGYNDMGFNSFFRSGWKRFYLKWYGEELASAKASAAHARWSCSTQHPVHQGRDVRVAAARGQAGAPPRPVRRLAALPPGPGHAQLARPASSRWTASAISGSDGEAVVFDETFIHHAARHQTDQQRVILFCDIERPILHGRFLAAVNRWFADHIMAASAVAQRGGRTRGRHQQASSRTCLPGCACRPRSSRPATGACTTCRSGWRSWACLYLIFFSWI